ncbi:hypothetical protein NE848_04250 [Gramella jeungdoensis]|uniref:DUF4468 domain-containing protein n=1 Tax=Gramella jeungdoensis TaxID=708091 RepID=A0ABT0YYL8_9FLAO|nr:hypothetical protein [Gramella jeungdoensis]MCM8568576.1 hypothetical protein [Gramella jeungdoensis]
MKIKTLILILGLAGFGFLSLEGKDPGPGDEKSEEIVRSVQDTLTWVHLKDSLKVKGTAVIVLRPDSLRFDYYLKSGDEWIYEVDSDFGFGITKALGSFQYPGISKFYTDKRFIELEDCKACPMAIDRDSIDYGLILTAPERNVRIDENIFGMEYYLEIFNEYFRN